MRSILKEIWSRSISVIDRTDIYKNGADNDYPNRVEAAIEGSVTATMAMAKFTDYLSGVGVEDDILVNKKKNLFLSDIVRMISASISKHKGAYIHINYDIEGDVNYLDVLGYKNCRISKSDDLGYKGMIYFSEDWASEKKAFGKKNKNHRTFYPYNREKSVITAQRTKDTPKADAVARVQGYRGQVLFLNFEPSKIYPLSYIDPCLLDADSEYRASVFKNTILRNGFMGKIVAHIVKSGDEVEDRKCQENIKKLIGAEESQGLLMVDTEWNADGNIQDVMKFDRVDSNIDDKIFKHTEESTSSNILMCCKNIPPLLVKSSDNSFMGSSASALVEAKKYYQEETAFERGRIELCLSGVLDRPVVIKKLIQDPSND